MQKAPLDLARLHQSFLPYRIILAVSAALGVVLGILVIAVGAFAAVMFIPVGVIAWIVAIAGLSASMTQLLLIGVGVALIIPIGAMIATNWRLHGIDQLIVRDFKAQPPPPGSRMSEVLEMLSTSAGLDEVPRYGVIENVFNAFAISSTKGASMVFLGKPLAEALAPSETLAVLGHEIGHVAMRDSERKFLMISHQEFLTSFLGISGLKRFARSIFGMVGELALAAHSRQREYWADAVGAYVTSPEMMISALRAIERTSASVSKPERRYNAIMFRPARSLFSTHPSTDQRVAALERRTYLDRLPTRAVVPQQPAEEEPVRYTGI